MMRGRGAACRLQSLADEWPMLESLLWLSETFIRHTNARAGISLGTGYRAGPTFPPQLWDLQAGPEARQTGLV